MASRRTSLHMVVALLLPLATAGFQWVLWKYIDPYVWFLFFPTVFFSSRIGGKTAGIISTVISAALVEYIFIPPTFALSGKDPHNLFTVAVFVFMGILFSYTHERLIKAETAEQKVQEENSALREQLQAAIIDQLKSERQQARKALYDNRAKLEAAFSSMSDAVFISDVNGRCIEFNESFVSFYRFGNEEECAAALADHSAFMEFYLPGGEMVPEADWPVSRALRGESVTGGEYTLRRADTGETWVGSYNYAPIYDDDGIIAGSVTTCRDITEQKRIAELVSSERTMLRTLIDAIPDLVWLKDPNGVYLTCNHEFEKLYGSAEADIVAKTDYDFVDAELADFFRENDRRAIAAGGPSTNDEWLTFANTGERRLYATIKTPMIDPDGRVIGVLGVARDITALEVARQELELRNEELERFDRASIGRELAMIQLKQQVNDLSRQMGLPLPYRLDFTDQAIPEAGGVMSE